MNDLRNSNENLLFSSAYGLTGSSGSGKTTACNMLAEKGCKIISADQIAREIMEKDEIGYLRTIAEFGTDILGPDKSIDRKKLHKIIFNDPKKLAQLESILHPIIRKQSEERIKEGLTNQKKIIIYETPLLYEKKLDSLPFKKIIYIRADEERLLERITNRDKISKVEAKKRLGAQLPDHEKKEKADIIIDNDGSLESFAEKISDLFNEL
jgi:dephospho-CoA kinase